MSKIKGVLNEWCQGRHRILRVSICFILVIKEGFSIETSTNTNTAQLVLIIAQNPIFYFLPIYALPL